MRKFRDDKVDPNDNGLRVPRRVVEAEGGKKKKKKKWHLLIQISN